MQSRFTSKAQEALNYAADTAAMLGHGYIGSEHLLIGLIKAEGGLASSVLLSNDITDEKIINLVCQLIAPDIRLRPEEALDDHGFAAARPPLLQHGVLRSACAIHEL